MNFEELVNTLNGFKTDSSFLMALRDDGFIDESKIQNKQVKWTHTKIMIAVDQYLITSTGQLNYKYIDKLKLYGFDVIVTERDSFGPLAAAIVCKEYKIAFG